MAGVRTRPRPFATCLNCKVCDLVGAEHREPGVAVGGDRRHDSIELDGLPGEELSKNRNTPIMSKIAVSLLP